MISARTIRLVLLFAGGGLVAQAAPPPSSFSTPASPSDALVDVAEYYASRYDYKKAGTLFGEALAKQSDNLGAALRLSEIQLMLDGRTVARDTLLRFYSAREASLTRDQKKQIKDKWAALHSVFLTDQAQTFFLQGVAMKERGDCDGAVALYQQSAALERGNIQILREKAFCEQKLKSYDRLYETFQSLHEADPFSIEFGENLAESLVYFREYRKAAEILSRDPDFLHDTRGKTAYAVATAEQGLPEPALAILTELSQAPEANVPPVVWYQLGVLLVRRENMRSEALGYLKKYLSLYSPKNTKVLWDPYRLEERAAEARRLVAARGK